MSERESTRHSDPHSTPGGGGNAPLSWLPPASETPQEKKNVKRKLLTSNMSACFYDFWR